MQSPAPRPYYVYILRCSNGSLYAGYTEDLNDRVKAHNDARGACWTAKHRPVELVYQERHQTEQSAAARERQSKLWTHNKKLALINGDLAALQALAKRNKGKTRQNHRLSRPE